MKVYVDELPKSCRDCPCSIYDELDCCWCKAINGELTYITDNDFESKRLNSCPLQSLTDYTKQVRKEVFADLKEKYKQKMANALSKDYEEGHWCCDKVLEELLQEIGFEEILELYQSQPKWYA